MARALGAILIALASLPSACAAQSYVMLGGERFEVEIADSVAERAQGLMDREQLATDHGMLFIYPDAAPRRFWMKNTKIPLDILYFDARGRLLNVQTAEPCRTTPCPVYPSEGPALLVLELNAGAAEQLGVQPGAVLEVQIAR